MDIKNESEINGITAKAIRENLGLRQSDFWGAVCISGARGCAYETGRTDIPKPIRRLLFLHYVLGVPTDISSREIRELGKVADPARRARRQMDNASTYIDEACVLLNRAKEVMNALP